MQLSFVVKDSELGLVSSNEYKNDRNPALEYSFVACCSTLEKICEVY